MRETEGGWEESEFRGRQTELEDVKTRLKNTRRPLLIYGQPLVGKASLAIQAADELRTENEAQGKGSIQVHIINCKNAVDWPDVLKCMCRDLLLDNMPSNETNLLNTIKGRQKGAKLLLLLIKLNNLKATGFDVDNLSRCLNSLVTFDVMTLVTSRRHLQLPCTLLLEPLTKGDVLQLFRHHAPHVQAKEFEQILQEHCYGLPPLVLRVAKLVCGDSNLSYTAQELAQALTSEPDFLINALDEETKKLSVNVGSEVCSQVISLVQLLGGTFSMKALHAALDRDPTRTKWVMKANTISEEAFIHCSPHRVCIEPLLQYHVRRLGHLATDDHARLRVVTLLGHVLLRAERDLYVAGQNIVCDRLYSDWPNLRHLLGQAIHCTGNTYHSYLQVAFGADKLLVKYFPGEALHFFSAMAVAAKRFGTHHDQAVLHGLIGMAVTHGQAGIQWDKALEHYQFALSVLHEHPQSVWLLRLLCEMGFTYFRLNQLHKSDRILKDALKISQQVDVDDERQVLNLLIRVRSKLAMPTIFRGHLSAGKALLLDTLEVCAQESPCHPDLPVLINSLGLVYERSDESQDLALHYYQQSLVERRRYADVAPGDLVPTLNNVGMQYARRNNFDVALQYLEEAASIRSRLGRWHFYTALTQHHLGHIYLQRADYTRAEGHLLEAACIYARCTPRHDARSKVSLSLAHVYIGQPFCDLSQVRKYLQQVCQLAENSGDDLSDEGVLVVLSSLQHQVQLLGWFTPGVEEFLKLGHQFLDKFDGDLSEKLRKHNAIFNILETLRDGKVTGDTTASVTSLILESCTICSLLRCSADVQHLWWELQAKGDRHLKLLNKLRTPLDITHNPQAKYDHFLPTVSDFLQSNELFAKPSGSHSISEFSQIAGEQQLDSYKFTPGWQGTRQKPFDGTGVAASHLKDMLDRFTDVVPVEQGRCRDDVSKGATSDIHWKDLQARSSDDVTKNVRSDIHLEDLQARCHDDVSDDMNAVATAGGMCGLSRQGQDHYPRAAMFPKSKNCEKVVEYFSPYTNVTCTSCHPYLLDCCSHKRSSSLDDSHANVIHYKLLPEPSLPASSISRLSSSLHDSHAKFCLNFHAQASARGQSRVEQNTNTSNVIHYKLLPEPSLPANSIPRPSPSSSLSIPSRSDRDIMSQYSLGLDTMPQNNLVSAGVGSRVWKPTIFPSIRQTRQISPPCISRLCLGVPPEPLHLPVQETVFSQCVSIVQEKYWRRTPMLSVMSNQDSDPNIGIPVQDTDSRSRDTSVRPNQNIVERLIDTNKRPRDKTVRRNQHIHEGPYFTGSRSNQDMDEGPNFTGIRSNQDMNEGPYFTGSRSNQDMNEGPNFTGIRSNQDMNEGPNFTGIRSNQDMNEGTNFTGIRSNQDMNEGLHFAGIRSNQDIDDGPPDIDIGFKQNIVERPIDTSKRPSDISGRPNQITYERPRDISSRFNQIMYEKPSDSTVRPNQDTFEEPHDNFDRPNQSIRADSNHDINLMQLSKAYNLHHDISLSYNENHPVQSHVVQSRSVQRHVAQGHIVQNHPVQNQTVQNHTIQNHTVQNYTVQNHPMQNYTVQNQTVQSHTVQSHTMQRSSQIDHCIRHRDSNPFTHTSLPCHSESIRNAVHSNHTTSQFTQESSRQREAAENDDRL